MSYSIQKLFLLFFFLFIATITSSESSNNSHNSPFGNEKRKLKILIYSVSWGWSHMQFLGKIADTLAEAGYEVHLLRLMEMDARYAGMTDTFKAHKIHVIRPSPTKIPEMDINRVAAFGDEAFHGESKSLLAKNLWLDFKKVSLAHWNDLNKILFAQCEEITHNPEWIARLEEEHYDVSIAEIWHTCPFAFFHRIGVRTKFAALATPLYQNAARLWGIPTFSSFVTSIVNAIPNAPNMSFLERFTNFCNDLHEYYFSETIQSEELLVRNAFGTDFPGLHEIARNISLIFVDTNPFFEMPRPISNKIVNIGGLVEMIAKPLSTELNTIMNSSSKDGVVFVSFGSLANARKMSVNLKLSLLRAFASFPRQNFIWKLEIDESGEDKNLFAKDTAPNVHLVKWVDQKALLLHPNLRAFITHCGQNSLNEAARAGVPVITIPLFGDQIYNSILAKEKGIAFEVSVAELNEAGGETLIIQLISLANNFASSPAYWASGLSIMSCGRPSVHITPMDKHHFVLPFMQMDQCMPQPEQEWFESFGLHFRMPRGTLCPQPGLLICYRSQLDPHRTTNGMAVAKQYQIPNHRAPAQQAIANKCRELNPKEGEIMHGIRVSTNEDGTNIILELSITDHKYALPMVDHFWINFGREYDLTTFIRLPNKERQIRMRRFYTRESESQGEFMKYIGHGAKMQTFPGLWLLGLDILPMEFIKELELFVHRDCKCPIQAWFTHPTDVVEPGEILSREFGSDKCNYSVTETSKYIGTLEKDNQITIWFSPTANTEFMEITLFAEDNKIFSLNIMKESIIYLDKMNWDRGFHAVTFDNAAQYLKQGGEIYIEINIYEFFIQVNYVEGGEKVTNNFWPSQLGTKFENCEIVFNTDAIIGQMDKKKIEHNLLSLPYSTRLTAAFEHKSKIIIHGKLHPNAKFFEINLMHDAPEWHEFIGATVLRIRIEFMEQERNGFSVIMDTYNSGKEWHDHIYKNIREALNQSEPFKCEILAKRLNQPNENGKQVLYKIRLNDTILLDEFYGDLPIWTTNWLWFIGDMDLLVEPIVEYTTANQKYTIVKGELDHLFNYEDAICISGFVQTDAIQFEINLFHEANEFDTQIGDTILRLQFYFDTNKENSQLNMLNMYDYLHEEGKWSTPNSVANPIGQTGVNFTIVIVAKEEDLYEIYINGGTVPQKFIPTKYSKYDKPSPPWGANWLTVSGYVENIKIGNESGNKECAKYGGLKPLPPNIKQVDKNTPLKAGNVITIQGTIIKGDATYIEVNLLREALAWHPIIGQTVLQAVFFDKKVSFNTYYNKEWKYERDDLSQKHRLPSKLEKGQQFLVKIEVKNEGYEIQIKIDESENNYNYSHQMPVWAVQYISVIGDLEGTSIQIA